MQDPRGNVPIRALVCYVHPDIDKVVAVFLKPGPRILDTCTDLITYLCNVSSNEADDAAGNVL